MSDIYNDVSNTLLEESQFNIALEWYDKAISKAIEGSHYIRRAKWLQNKGLCYHNLEQYSSAREVYNQGIDIAGNVNGYVSACA